MADQRTVTPAPAPRQGSHLRSSLRWSRRTPPLLHTQRTCRRCSNCSFAIPERSCERLPQFPNQAAGGIHRLSHSPDPIEPHVEVTYLGCVRHESATVQSLHVTHH